MPRRRGGAAGPLSLALSPEGRVGETGEHAFRTERSLPAEPGAYALHFRVDEPLPLPIARLGRPTLAPGLYVYAGSARGPGGIAARVARHLRADKAPHWHVDHLSARAACVAVEAFPDGAECEIVAALAAAGAGVPVPGFGSSDCRVCAAHLLRLAGEARLAGPGQNRDSARRMRDRKR